MSFDFDYSDMYPISLIVEGFFYGLYSGIFALYLQYQTSKKGTNKGQNIIFYLLCALYVFCVLVFVCDITGYTVKTGSQSWVGTDLGKEYEVGPVTLRIEFIEGISFGCSDFVAQLILIYRCWIVWGCNTCVVIIPSTLALTFLVTWIVAESFTFLDIKQYFNWVILVIMDIPLSLFVNTLVTGLIVFRIFKVFREIKANSDDQILGAPCGSKLRPIIFILIESGMILFSVQFIRVVVIEVAAHPAMGTYPIIITIHQMLNGIIPTTTLLRTSMGLSFYDEKSMEEAAIGSLRFASNHLNSVPETGSISVVDQDNSANDDIGVQRSNGPGHRSCREMNTDGL